MKKLLTMFRAWLKRYRYKRRCRHYYKLYHKLFWLYAEKTSSATDAVMQTQKVVDWFLDLDKEYKDFI